MTNFLNKEISKTISISIIFVIIIAIIIGALLFYLIPKIPEIICEQKGGNWGAWSDIPDAPQRCNLPTSDAGEECTDSSQCESYCQTQNSAIIGTEVIGECYGFELFTCIQKVENGLASGMMCQ